jgi:SMODS and SLOG-associating 2TM effector domain 1/SMODS and SLOG-associating 2TM effector domain 3
MPETIERNDFPRMYRLADDKSVQAQRIFLRWNVVNFVALILGALVVALKEWIPGAPVISAVLLAAGAAMTFWLRKNRYERGWYRSRAVAESVKTLTWRYMMCAAPYDRSLDTPTATRLFNGVLHEIALQEPEVDPPEPVEVTAKMQAVRTWPAADRLEAYLAQRIADQREWYSKKSKQNARSGDRLLYLAAATQVLALVFALLLINFETLPDIVGVVASISASLLAWMQLKRYEDVSQAYLTAAKELSHIQGAAPARPSDDDLSRYVIDSENAVSREHTLWLAKRS